MENLKPCPFCGGEAAIRIPEYPLHEMRFISCTSCAIQTAHEFSEKGAIDSWNRRTPIKWPTEKDVYAASAKACKNDSLRQYYFEKGVEWLKSFVEKGDGNG